MRRCPSCQAPQPDNAVACTACGRALLGRAREPWLRWDDLFNAQALRRCALACLPLLVFALSAMPWLAGGAARVEARVMDYHLLHGLLLGGALAWARRERPVYWLLWLGAGLAGGFLAEGLDLWFNYRQIFSGVALWLWAWLGLADRPTLVYEILQGLRLLGPVLALGLVFATVESRPARRLQAPLWVLLALAAGTQVRGILLAWGVLRAPSLAAADTWALFFASRLALVWGLGPRGQKAVGGP